MSARRGSRARLIASAAGMLLAACGDSGVDPEPMEELVATAKRIFAEDLGNAGHAGDVEVAFLAPTDAGVAELRVILVPVTTGALSPADALVLAAERYVALSPDGGTRVVRLEEGLLDAAGAVVAEGSAYTVQILSVADPAGEATSSLAVSSEPLELGPGTVRIRYLGNDGVLISDDTHRVAIDAPHAATGWIVPPATEQAALAAGHPPYHDIDLVLTTHAHADHVSTSDVNSLLAASGARYVAPPQLGGISGSSRLSLAPVRGEEADTVLDGLELSVMHLRHFDQFGNDFSTIDNYGYLVELGGRLILHLGDVEYSVANLEPFDLPARGIDVVFLPTFNTLLSSSNAQVVEEVVAPAHVVALHFQAGAVASESAQAASLYPGATTFTTPMAVLVR